MCRPTPATTRGFTTRLKKFFQNNIFAGGESVAKPHISERSEGVGGFTLVELMVSIAILTLLIGSSIAIINPPLIYAKARDTQRLADLANLSASIDHYIIDFGHPPATINSMRLSDSLPLGQVGPLQNAKTGWIEGDMSKYTRKLFTDPTNSGDFVYRYKNDGVSFELDCQFEFLTLEQTRDGGNNATRYELGTDLTLM